MLDEVGERIRPGAETDIPAINALFHEVFGERRDERSWRWKYFQTPRPSFSVVCEARGKIVAHCGGVAVEFIDHGQRYLAYQLVDFMSSPKYPGGIGAGGVFVRTADSFLRRARAMGAKWVYGFPGERHRLVGERLLGYRALEPVGELTLATRGSSGKIVPLRKDFLSSFAAPPIDLGASRDTGFLEWRYLSHPTHLYGYVEVRRWLRRPTIVAIVRERDEAIDVMELGGSFADSAVEKLVETLALLGRPVRFWCSLRHSIARKLIQFGFQGSNRDHWIVGAWFRPEGPDAASREFFIDRTPRAGGLYYTLGDYDVF